MEKSEVDQTAKLAAAMERDLGAIHHAMRRALKAEVAKGELTGPQTAVMRIVVGNPGVSLRDLSREVSLAHSTVSGIVDRLETRGMVQRTTDGADGRIVRVLPTAAVTSWIETQLPHVKTGPLQRALLQADPEEREALAKAVARLRALLSSAPESA
ncbi:MarR family transcriptional regulator [Acidobacteria bacterium AB60]|nr:MarR family transcriptional regulator [Acidobacteria bacterium AB60]